MFKKKIFIRFIESIREYFCNLEVFFKCCIQKLSEFLKISNKSGFLAIESKYNFRGIFLKLFNNWIWCCSVLTLNSIFLTSLQCSFGDDLVHSLLQPLELELQKTMHTYCGRVYKVFIKQLTKSVRDLYAKRSKGRWSLLQSVKSRDWINILVKRCKNFTAWISS